MLEIARAFTQVKPRAEALDPLPGGHRRRAGAARLAVLRRDTRSTRSRRPLANINIDGINQWGRTKDITVVGLGASDLDDYLRDAAAEQSRTLRPDPSRRRASTTAPTTSTSPSRACRRSTPTPGVEVHRQADASTARQKRDEYTNNDYHGRPTRLSRTGISSGAVEDAQLLLAVGYRVANADKFPEWKPGNEFKAKRDEMMKKTVAVSSSSLTRLRRSIRDLVSELDARAGSYRSFGSSR